MDPCYNLQLFCRGFRVIIRVFSCTLNAQSIYSIQICTDKPLFHESIQIPKTFMVGPWDSTNVGTFRQHVYVDESGRHYNVAPRSELGAAGRVIPSQVTGH